MFRRNVTRLLTSLWREKTEIADANHTERNTMKSKTQKLAGVGEQPHRWPRFAWLLPPRRSIVILKSQASYLGPTKSSTTARLPWPDTGTRLVRDYAQRMIALQREEETMRTHNRYCLTIVVAAVALVSATIAQPRDKATLTHSATLSGFKETDDVDD